MSRDSAARSQLLKPVLESRLCLVLIKSLAQCNTSLLNTMTAMIFKLQLSLTVVLEHVSSISKAWFHFGSADQKDR